MKQFEQKLKIHFDALLKNSNFLFASRFFEHFKDARLYVVGGAVRDILLDRDIKDYDFVVEGVSPEDLETYLVEFGKVDFVGKHFGVYKLISTGSDSEIDIAFPRTEFSTGFGYDEFHVSFDESVTIQDDVVRRDFTVNALVYSLKDGVIIDEVGGVEDLQSGILRTVGNPVERFEEDYTRLFRAVRFFVQLGFSFDAETQQGVTSASRKLHEVASDLSYEVIRDEFFYSISADVSLTIRTYDEVGILEFLFPEIENCKGVEQSKEHHPEGDVYQHILKISSKVQEGDSLRLRLACMFHDIAKPQTQSFEEKNTETKMHFHLHEVEGVDVFRKIAQRLKFSKRLTHDVSFLIRNHLYLWHGNIAQMKLSTVSKKFVENGTLGDDLLQLHRYDISREDGGEKEAHAYLDTAQQLIIKLKEELQIQNGRAEMPVSGADIMKELLLVEGKEVGEYLERAREFYMNRLLSGEKPTKEQILDFLENE